jgi:hypothetical protein
MTIMLLVFFVALAVAGAFGWCVDSRDTDFSLGAILHPRSGGSR